MILARVEKRVHGGEEGGRWVRTHSEPYLVVVYASGSTKPAEQADELARAHQGDNPEYRAAWWDRDIRISVYAVPDDTTVSELKDGALAADEVRTLLGGTALMETAWFQELHTARTDFMAELSSPANARPSTHPPSLGGAEVQRRWQESHTRAKLLEKQPR